MGAACHCHNRGLVGRGCGDNGSDTMNKNQEKEEVTRMGKSPLSEIVDWLIWREAVYKAIAERYGVPVEFMLSGENQSEQHELK